MKGMLDQLERAIRRGVLLSATVAACSSEQLDDSASGGASPTATAASGGTFGSSGAPAAGDAGMSDGGMRSGPSLVAYPKLTYPLCSGTDYGAGGEFSGYYGQCCVDPQCFTPTSGECPAADQVDYEQLPDFPPGSGSCGCYPESGKAVEGPFGPRSDDQAVTPGRCCYLVASIGCEGRPLLVAGAARVARRTRRADWTSRPSWV